MSRQNNNSRASGSGCGTNGALLELLADIYTARTNATELGGAIFDNSAFSPKRADSHHHTDPNSNTATGNNNNTTGGGNRGGNSSRRATTLLQSRIAEAIGRSSDKELLLASRRWLAAVFRAQCVWIDDHPTTPTRRGFVASPHDFFDVRLLQAPASLEVIPSSTKRNNTASPAAASSTLLGDQQQQQQSLSTGASQQPSPNRTNNAAASPSPQRPAGLKPLQISTQLNPNPISAVDLMKRYMIRPQEVSSCLWYEGGLKLRAVLDRPVENLSRELAFRTLMNEEILGGNVNSRKDSSSDINNTNNENNNDRNNNSSSSPYQSISTMGGVGEFFEGLVLEYVQDEEGVWTRVSPVPYNVDRDGTVSSGGECHGFGLESVAPSWHCENRYTASQFAEPNSLMVSRTPTEVVVALPWGEKERVYGMLFLPPHVDDRYARLLAWDIFVSARVAFGSAQMCQPTQKEIKNLVKKSQKAGFDDQTPSKEIAPVLGNLRAKVIPEAVQTIMALRRRYSPCPILPLSLTPLSPARSDVAVERIVLEICAYVFRAIGAADFAIFHDHRVLYTNVSLAVTGVLQNVHHLLRTQALDSGEFSANLPSWSGSNDLDHVNDAATLIAPVLWPPGQCLAQLCAEGTPQKSELPHRFCSLWTVGHNNFASSSIEVVFVLPPTPTSSSNSNNNNNQPSFENSSNAPHHAAAFYDFVWSKTQPTLMWEIHDALYPLFVLTQRLNDAVLFCQKRAYATTGAGDGNNINGGGSVGLPVSLSPDGTTSNVNAQRNVTFEIHKLGYAQSFTSSARGLGNGGHQLQPFQLQHQNNNNNSNAAGGRNQMTGSTSNLAPNSANNNNAKNNNNQSLSTRGGGGSAGFLHNNAGATAIGSATNFGISSGNFPNVAAGGGGASGVGGNLASALQPPAFVLNDNVDPDCYELDRTTRLAASFAFSNLRPTRELWCSGGSSYSGLFSSDAQMKQEPCVRLRPAASPGVVLTTVAGADATQFTLSENRNTYCFPLCS